MELVTNWAMLLILLVIGVLLAKVRNKLLEVPADTSIYLKRFQIQVYDAEDNMILINIYEGFTFEEACQNARADLYKKIDLNGSLTLYPIRFFSSTANK